MRCDKEDIPLGDHGRKKTALFQSKRQVHTLQTGQLTKEKKLQLTSEKFTVSHSDTDALTITRTGYLAT